MSAPKKLKKQQQAPVQAWLKTHPKTREMFVSWLTELSYYEQIQDKPQDKGSPI